MAVPNNYLQNVQTYQMAELAFMLNENCAINISNKKFKDFDKLTGNLGDTVTFDMAPLASAQYGLVVNAFQPSVQRVQSLVCSQAALTCTAFTDQQFIFNAVDYMERFGKSRILELGTAIETDILKQITSSVTIQNPENPNSGQIVDPASGPFRFYTAGVSGSTLQNITSYQQLVQAQVNFMNYGGSRKDPCVIIPDVSEPSIINNGLSQFTMNRGNEDAEKWEIMRVGNYKYYQSNLLPIHISGNVGQNYTTLTLVSTNDPTGNNITQLTFSGATASDLNAIKNADLAQFQDGVGSLPNLRYLQPIGKNPSSQPVQFRMVGDAAADSSGNVTVNIFPALKSTPGIGQSSNIGFISSNLQAGMQIKVMPSHRAGVIMSGNPLYLAMPELPDMDPYKTVTTMDSESGVSIRHYWGSGLGNNTRGYIWDCIWGSTLLADNSMRLLFTI